MKRMISIFLTAALLISLLSTTVFAGNGDEIEITLSLPSVGDTISTDKLALTTSLDDASCLVLKIYSGVTVNDVTAITSSESLVSFCNNDANKVKEATDTYAQEEYVVLFSITSSNITQNSTLSVANLTSGKLFFREGDGINSIYGYVAFTPSDATGSNNNTTDATTNITDANGRDSHDVYVTYQEGASSPTIYSVDIVWQSMEFTYTAASEGTWDPEAHDYTNKQNASWSFENNKITVTNHSNAEVKAKFTYTSATNFRAVNGAFVDVHKNAIDNATLTLSSAVGYAREAAPSGDAFLSLSGELPSSLETQTICGTVTVTIN